MTRADNFNSLKTSLKDSLCRSWCDSVDLTLEENVIIARLPIEWPNGEFVYCYVQEKGGSLCVSDWGGLHEELDLYGIHSTKMLDSYASALGFSIYKHEEILKYVKDSRDVPKVILELNQLAAAAIAEVTGIHFAPPAMIVASAWQNALRQGLRARPGLRIGMGGEGHSLATNDLFDKSPVVIYKDVPLLIAPYVDGQKRSGLTKLYYLGNEGDPSIKGVVPLVKIGWSDKDARRLLGDVAKVCAAKGREFIPVEIHPGEDRFDEKLGRYPALDAMSKGVTVVDDVLDRILPLAS